MLCDNVNERHNTTVTQHDPRKIVWSSVNIHENTKRLVTNRNTPSMESNPFVTPENVLVISDILMLLRKKRLE